MTKVDLVYDILNYTPASASPVEANLDRLEQHINQEVIERDGTVAMRAQLRLVGDPVQDLDATPKQYVDSILPVGIIMMFGGSSVPPGGRWAVCNGAELESAIYPQLYAVIGANFSPAGTPAGRFNLPNLVDRFPVGSGSIAALGKTGGNRNPTVTAHSHQMDHGHPQWGTHAGGSQHTHTTPEHRHAVNGNTGGESAGHWHGPPPGSADYLVGMASSNYLQKGGTAQPYGGGVGTGWNNVGHTHRVDIWSAGIDGGPQSTTTANADHAHTVDTPAHTGRSGTEGVTDTGANLPPFLGVAYIMRVK